jgi:alkylation response protein AidB-like acyl-CoA dehydrogenase
MPSTELKSMTAALAELAPTPDAAGDWPEASIDLIAQAGCWTGVIPQPFGPGPRTGPELLQFYEALGKGDLSVALILTQHDGACELIAAAENDGLKNRLLPEFAAGRRLATVGISQLTTSKRGKGPLMRAEYHGDGFRLTGLMPWVTSAKKCAVIVTGAVLPDDQQILACVAADSVGLTIGEPLDLLALRASWTSEVRCDQVRIEKKDLLRGPVTEALSLRSPVKPLVVSAVGLGLADAMREDVQALAEKSGPPFDPIVAALNERFERVHRHLYDAAGRLSDPVYELPAYDIRADVNALLMELMTAHMTLSKGSGYVTGRRSHRLVREAIFFLVWSAPLQVQVDTLTRVLRID